MEADLLHNVGLGGGPFFKIRADGPYELIKFLNNTYPLPVGYRFSPSRRFEIVNEVMVMLYDMGEISAVKTAVLQMSRQ